MEKFDLFDDNRLPLKKTAQRGAKCKVGENRQVVHICIFNSKNEMLIQQRHPCKNSWANLWDVSVGGSSISSETSRDSAQRELFEELGLNYNFSNERPFLTINFENGFDDFYFLNKDLNLDDLKLQKEEVQNVKWASREEIKLMIEKQTFIPYVETFIDSLFDLKNQRGIIKI